MRTLSILALVSLLLIPTQVKSESVCFADVHGVRKHSPEAYPSWTMHMPGHKNEKCWFPASKSNKHFHETKQTERIVAKKEVPVPRQKVVLIVPEQQIEQYSIQEYPQRHQSYIDEVWSTLVYASIPSQRIYQTFLDLGFRN